MIRKFDIAYFMISVDSLEDNKAFAEKEHADFPLLANPDKKVALAYGVVSPEAPPERQLARRWTFYIDPDRQDRGDRPGHQTRLVGRRSGRASHRAEGSSEEVVCDSAGPVHGRCTVSCLLLSLLALASDPMWIDVCIPLSA